MKTWQDLKDHFKDNPTVTAGLLRAEQLPSFDPPHEWQNNGTTFKHLSEIVVACFRWDQTQEGIAYWARIEDELIEWQKTMKTWQLTVTTQTKTVSAQSGKIVRSRDGSRYVFYGSTKKEARDAARKAGRSGREEWKLIEEGL